MRILVCYPGHVISTVDVAIGWEKALKKTGNEVFQLAYEYNVPFYGAVLEAWDEWNPEFGFTLNDVLWLASQDLVCKVIECLPLDLVVLVTGLLVHERGYQLLEKLGVPVCVIFTEAPYNDHMIEPMVKYIDVLFINDKASLPKFRELNPATFYMPHSYDPERHHLPQQPIDGEYKHEVFFLGSMYEERKALFKELEEIDLGMDVSLDIYATSMDGRGRLTGGMQNEELVKHYWGSDIVLSPNRTTKDYFEKTQITDPAWSLGPRVYEVAACGAFQLTDDGRPELREVFGDVIPVYRDAEELASLIKHYSQRPVEREALAQQAREKVAPCSFENRAKEIFIPRVQEVLGNG
jgi:spore maturation protein CgeB